VTGSGRLVYCQQAVATRHRGGVNVERGITSAPVRCFSTLQHSAQIRLPPVEGVAELTTDLALIRSV
jgi:hypothetical protein